MSNQTRWMLLLDLPSSEANIYVVTALHISFNFEIKGLCSTGKIDQAWLSESQPWTHLVILTVCIGELRWLGKPRGGSYDER